MMLAPVFSWPLLYRSSVWDDVFLCSGAHFDYLSWTCIRGCGMCYSEQFALCLASFTFHSRFIPGSEEHLWSAGAAWACHISAVPKLLCAARSPAARKQATLRTIIREKPFDCVCWIFGLLCTVAFFISLNIETSCLGLKRGVKWISLWQGEFSLQWPHCLSIPMNWLFLCAERVAFVHSFQTVMPAHFLSKYLLGICSTNCAWKHRKWQFVSVMLCFSYLSLM